ncbi:helix-turn-helix domain-containing protein [Streptomyces sp. NPDC054866]
MHPPPPFNARAARMLRDKLGMAPGHVAYGMRVSYGLEYVSPEHVTAWEQGRAVPTSNELAALAGALWCAPHELIGAPRTLRDHRLASGLAIEDVSRATGLDVRAYQHMEETNTWAGNRRQSAHLGAVLQLGPRDFVAVTGLEDELARLLGEAVNTRWQAHIRPIAKLLSMERRALEDPLKAMHQEYQSLLTATLGRVGNAAASGETGRRYLEDIVDHFWSRFPGSDPGGT